MVYPSRTSKRRRRLLDGLLHFINTSRTRVRESYALHTIYASKDPLNAEGTTLEAGVRDRGGSGNYYRRGRFHSKASKILFTVPVLAVTVLAFFYLTGAILNGNNSVFIPLGQKQNFAAAWGAQIFAPNGSTGDITHNVTPLNCHSHNDYRRSAPLYEALHYGCTSIEADIWLTNKTDDSELYVGHSMSSLKQDRTLRSMYINPLLELLDATNRNETSSQAKGVFHTAPAQALVLLIDIKNKPGQSFDALTKHIEPFRARNYLTHHNGSALISSPLTIVMSGSTPYASILAQPSTKRDIFFDAPLNSLTPPLTKPSESDSPATHEIFEDYNTTTSLYASASLRLLLGQSPFPFFFPWSPTSRQLKGVRSATAAAHARGLQVRWWDTPVWPRTRGWLWGFLVREGADVLSVDDMGAVSSWLGKVKEGGE